jgi:beta-phosphoglucomutase-like phosphatase (HAD superfamily)
MLLVGFDIDGTLLRVRPQPVRTALRAALQETLGIEVPPEALTDLAGKTDLQILREVAHRLARRVLLRKLAREFIRRYEERYFRLVQPEAAAGGGAGTGMPGAAGAASGNFDGESGSHCPLEAP